MIGNILVMLALVCGALSAIMYFYTFRGYKNTLNIARISYHAMTVILIVASAYLLHLILNHHYEYKYIFDNSNAELPLGYLISTFWAGQEGSFLLWALLAALSGVLLQSYTAKRNIEPGVMAVFTATTAFLIFMLTPAMKNPFAMIFSDEAFIPIKYLNPAIFDLSAISNFIFNNDAGQNFVNLTDQLVAQLKAIGIPASEIIIKGKGLNPLLQNFWMQIHPPILFVGFAISAVPYSFAVDALMRNNYKDWVKDALPWILGTSAALGAGIMLGGYWSYGVLGWGGYWAWDPVENSSLVPWLISVAVIHTLYVQRKGQKETGRLGKYARTNLLLAILVFIFVIYSTFLTRSGILSEASVHSFVDPGTLVYLFLILYIVSFLLLGVIMLIYRWQSIEAITEPDKHLLSRDLSMFSAAVLVGASALIVLVGTSLPIFGSTVEISFYNEMHRPLTIIMGLLIVLSLSLNWFKTKPELIFKRIRLSGALTVITTALIIFLGDVYNLTFILLIFSASFAMYHSFIVSLEKFKDKKIELGSYTAHIGIAIFVLGVVGSTAYDSEVDLDLREGETEQALGYNLTYTGLELIDGKYHFNVKVDQNEEDEHYVAKPVMYESDVNNSLMREPYIITWAFVDMYISPLGYSDGTSGSQKDARSITITPGAVNEFYGTTITYKEFIKPDMEAMSAGMDFNMGVVLIIEKGDVSVERDVNIVYSEQQPTYPEVKLPEFGISMQLNAVDPMTKEANLTVFDTTAPVKDRKPMLTVTASTKPFVNLVWLGVILVIAGTIIATVRRLRESLGNKENNA